MHNTAMYCVIPEDFDVKYGKYSLAVKDCMITKIGYGTQKKCNVFGLLADAATNKEGKKFVKKVMERGVDFEHLLMQARWDMVHCITSYAEMNRIMSDKKIGHLHKNAEFKECWTKGGRARTALAIKNVKDIDEFGTAIQEAAEWMEGNYD